MPVAEKMTIQPKTGDHSTEGCGSLVKVSQRLLVDAEGGIRNAVVWLEKTGGEGNNPVPASAQKRVAALPLAPASGPLLMDQRQCVFEPHVVAIPFGREIAIRNSDTAIHNIRIFREGNPSMLMHQWQKPDAADVRWRFTEPGRFIIRCGVHPWMYAWVFVAPGDRVAVTDEEGRYTLADVPAGRHTLHVWHETLGERQLSLEVHDGAVTEVPEILFSKETEKGTI